LDECNGRFGVTNEYPNGTYHYVISTEYPYIPRCFHGKPDRSFMRGKGGGQRGEGMREPNVQRKDHGGARQGGHQPPAFAIEACKGYEKGDQVKMKTPRGHEIIASCRMHNGVLFAVPPHR
ncbi:MAG: YHYH protein, partial [Pontibacterium sp.]